MRNNIDIDHQPATAGPVRSADDESAIGRMAIVSAHETSSMTDFQRCIRRLPRRGQATQAAHTGWVQHWDGVMVDRVTNGACGLWSAAF